MAKEEEESFWEYLKGLWPEFVGLFDKRAVITYTVAVLGSIMITLGIVAPPIAVARHVNWVILTVVGFLSILSIFGGIIVVLYANYRYEKTR